MDFEKTLIIMDTNKTRSTLGGSPRYDSFSFGKDFETLRTFIDENDLSDTVILAITEMTLKELLSQKKKVYEEDKETLRAAVSRLRNLENASIPEIILPDDSFDCTNYLAPKVEKFLKENKIEVIRVKDGDKAPMLDTLIQNVIDVIPPFKSGKNNSSSGHGFKDAVIWETVNLSSTLASYKNVVLLTDDSDFDGCESDVDGINFKIIKSNEFLIEDLKIKYRAKMLKKKYSDLSTNQYFITNLKQTISSELDCSKDDVQVLSLLEDVIDKPTEIQRVFSLSEYDEVYLENMVCFVSKVKIQDSEYKINILVDLGSNEIETIQVEAIK